MSAPVVTHPGSAVSPPPPRHLDDAEREREDQAAREVLARWGLSLAGLGEAKRYLRDLDGDLCRARDELRRATRHNLDALRYQVADLTAAQQAARAAIAMMRRELDGLAFLARCRGS